MVLVSVLLSVYNGEKYLEECIESILSQTLKDLELLITDDCSTDGTLKIILEYQSQDNRIKLIKNEENIGLTKSLNNMLDISNSKYIARMDASDVCLPTRLEKQVEYLERHPEIGVCAVDSRKKNVHGSKGSKYTLHEEIRTSLLFSNGVPHCSVMFRGSVILENNIRYNEDFKIIQDYELWCRLINITKFTILRENLIQFRTFDDSVTILSSKKSNYREGFLKEIHRANLEKINISCTEEEIELHGFVSNNKIIFEIEKVLKLENWLIKLNNHNEASKFYIDEILKKIIENNWYNICARSSSIGLKIFFIYYKSKLRSYKNEKNIKLIKLFLKTLVKYKAEPQGRYV